MKLLVIADPHLRFKPPRIRKDDYVFTQFRKFEWVCNLANEHEAKLIITGDLYDKPVCPLTWLNKFITLFKSVKNGVYSVFGQHDIFYHNPETIRTPYGVMVASEAIKTKLPGFDMVNFEEEIPDISGGLCIHFPITQYEPPFYMENALSAKDFMDKYPMYDIVLSGDWHESFVYKTENPKRILINAGPLMRMDKTKIDYQPLVYLLDTESLECTAFEVPIEKDVFDLDKADKDDMSQYKKDIRELANSIKVQSVGKKFSEVLESVLVEGGATKTSRIIISEVMEKVYERLGKN